MAHTHARFAPLDFINKKNDRETQVFCTQTKLPLCPKLLIFEFSNCTLRIFRGYDFSIVLILLFLDRYFGGFDSDL